MVRHVAAIKSSAFRMAGSILSFYYSKSGCLTDSALKLYKNKVIPHLLYGVEMWGWYDINPASLEVVQNHFLRCIRVLPMASPAVLTRAKTGIPSLKAQTHLVIIRY